MNKIHIHCFTIIFLLIAKFSFPQTQVTFYTSMGNFVVQLEDKKTPVTTANFIKLVNQKFYDGQIFHRVVKNFVIQGGDPTGTGNGGPGYTIADEFDSLSNVQKTIGMANEGTPHSSGSQFYFNLVNNLSLDHRYSVFGKVISNFVVVQNIGKVIVDSADRPKTKVYMDSLRITAPSGIIEKYQEIFFEAYPNPLKLESTMFIYSINSATAGLIIYNQIGDLVYSGTYFLEEGRNPISLANLTGMNCTKGIYYFVLSEGKNITKQRFIFF